MFNGDINALAAKVDSLEEKLAAALSALETKTAADVTAIVNGVVGPLVERADKALETVDALRVELSSSITEIRRTVLRIDGASLTLKLGPELSEFDGKPLEEEK